MYSEVERWPQVRHELTWRLGKLWLTEADRLWVDANLTKIVKIDTERLRDALRHCWPEISRNISDLAVDIPVLESFADAIDAVAQPFRVASARTIEEQREVVQRLSALADSDDIMLIKGAAMVGRGFFAAAMSDTDVLVRDIDAAWPVLELGEKLGYVPQRMKLMASKVSPYFGYCNMYKNSRGRADVQAEWDLGWMQIIDLHVARFVAGGESALDADAFDRAERRDLYGTTMLVPAVADCLLIEIAHVAKHGTVNMRSVNRIAALLSDELSDAFDEEYAISALEWNHLRPLAFAVLTATESSYDGAVSARAAHLAARVDPGSPIRGLARAVAERRRAERYGGANIATAALQALYVARSSARQYPSRRAARLATAAPARLFATRGWHPRAHSTAYGQASILDIQRQPVTLVRCPQPVSIESGPDALVGKRARLFGARSPSEALVTPAGTYVPARYDGSRVSA